jgi:hypothetical protein
MKGIPGRVCYSKIQFSTRKAAQDSMARLRRNHPAEKNHAKLTVYKCEHCGLYHLGHRT